MSQPKNLLSEEELLKLLESGDEIIIGATIREDVATVLAFLAFFDISPGTYSISRNSLYRLYQSWNLHGHLLLQRDFYNIVADVLVQPNNGRFLINNAYLTLAQKLLPKPKKHRDTSRARLIKFNEYLQRTNTIAGHVWIRSIFLYKDYKQFIKMNKFFPRLDIKGFNKFLKTVFEHQTRGYLYVRIQAEKAKDLKRRFKV